MIPKSYKKLSGVTMDHDYKSNVDIDGELSQTVTMEYLLRRKIDHEMFNIPQQMPPNVKSDI